MTPKWSECSSNSYTELSSHENGECKSTLIGTVPSSTSSFGLPTANRMCSLSAQKKDGNVYKRRKMDKDSNSLAAHEEAKETMTSNLTAGTIDPILDCEEPAGISLEPNSGMNNICMVSSITTPPFMILNTKDAAACSSSNISPTEPITELMSPRNLCISILRKDGLITESRTRIATEFTDSDASPLLTCNTCGGLEHSLKMLICDSCEAAFHLSCCIPCIKELPTDEWYCVPCSKKNPRVFMVNCWRARSSLREYKPKASWHESHRVHAERY